VFTTLLVYIDQKHNGTVHTSDFLSTAGHHGCGDRLSVDLGGHAAAVVQSGVELWRLRAFLVCKRRHDPGQLFVILAIEVKRHARKAHTVCGMILARWGKPAHVTFIFFRFLTNIIVTSMLLLGGAVTVNALTGMDTNLASFLIPWCVILYTAAGGLKATFLGLVNPYRDNLLGDHREKLRHDLR